METFLAAIMGLGLAASCGLRVFLPMLAVGIAAKTGLLHPPESMAWLASWPALIALGTAAIAESTASLVPLVDHALDTVAAPAAVIAGALMAAAPIHDMSPTLAWVSAAVAGGGAAGAVKAASVSLRGVSTISTAGMLNPVISAVESAAAAVLAVVSIVLPVLAGVFLLLIALIMVRAFARRRARLSRNADRRRSGGFTLAS